MKSLVVYYSYDGECEEIAKSISEGISSDLLKIVPKNEKKKEGFMKYLWCGVQSFIIKKPELVDYEFDLAKYDNIFIGSPVWFGSYAPAINTFLSENRIERKNIFLFICSKDGKGDTYKDFEEALCDNKILDKAEFVFPLKNGMEEAKKKAKDWAILCLEELKYKA